MPHRRRFDHDASLPVHVTVRAVAGFSWFRRQRIARAVFDVIRRAQREDFRIVEFSLQTNHLHLLVEAVSTSALRSGVAGLKIRMAKRINRLLLRRGALWAGRWHGRLVTSLRQVRRVLVYVLANAIKHGSVSDNPDPLSSAPWFDGWARKPTGGKLARAPNPALPARTHALARGWRRYGLLRADEHPASTLAKRTIS